MRANPEPNDVFTFTNAHGAVVQIDSDGIDRQIVVNLLKLQSRVLRILLKQTVGRSSLLFNNPVQTRIQLPKFIGGP